MDTKKNGSENVPEVQEPMVRSAEEKAEQRRQKACLAVRLYRQRYPDRVKENSKRSYDKNKHKYKPRQKIYNKQYYLDNRDKIIAQSAAYHKEHWKEKIEWQRMSRKELRQRVIEAYGGPICKCCGETQDEFLTIDHIYNNGKEERKKAYPSGRNTAGTNFYQWLRKNNFPDGYQVLCMQCNWTKGKRGICPHQVLRTPIDLFFESQQY